MANKNIVLVDDHIIIRNGLKELIQKLGPYVVIKEFDTGPDLLGAFPIEPAPDLIILDLTMPEMSGDEVVAALRTRNNSIPILILTLINDDNRIIRLFRNGVRGYMSKSCTAKMMREALNEIFTTGFYHNELMTLALQTIDKPDSKSKQEVLLEKLSVKEKQFLKLTCHEDEYTYDQIAGIMGVQHRTIDAYRESVFGKLNVKSKAGLVLFVFKNGLLDYLSST